MQAFEYYAPTKIVFGKDAEQKTGQLIRDFGGSRVLVIYGGKSAKRIGLLDNLETSLREADLSFQMTGGVVPNPRLSTAKRMVQEALDFQADFILAVGGGSVHDTAKAVAHGTANSDIDLWDFWTRKAKVEKSLPIGSVLTISAAGSETSDSSVLTNDELDPWVKRGLNTDFNRCKFTVMNPELTMTLPVWQIAAGAADIFMHTDERYFAKFLGNHLTDEFAEGLLRDTIAFGPKAVENPHDYEAMSELMWCGSVSHVGLTGLGSRGDTGRDGDWAIHQLGMAISALYDSTHGATLTACWGSWARYVLSENPARFAQLGRRVYGLTGGDDTALGLEAINRTEAFFKKIGMPLSISELLGKKVTREEIIALAESCSYGKTRTIGSFKTLDYDDMLKIYEMAAGELSST